MEDPNSRPEAAKLINSVIQEHSVDKLEMEASGVFRAGLSLSMKIYNALVKAGYNLDEKKKEGM